MKTVLSLFLFISVSLSVQSQSLCTYYLDQSHHYTYNGEYEKALSFTTKAIKMYPDSARCYFERGGAYFFMDSLDQAYIDLEHYITMKPKDSKGYHWRGLILMKSRVYNEAESDFETCFKLNPSSDYNRIKLAESRLFQNKLALAEEELKKLLKKDPNLISCYNLLGLLYEKKEDLNKSVHYYTQGIENNPNTTSLFYNRARVNMELGNKDAACEDWNTAGRLGAVDAEIWMDANNCAGLNGLSEIDKAFDNQELFKSSKDNLTSINVTPNYLPMLHHARYTYVSEYREEIDTAAMVIGWDYQSRTDYYFELPYYLGIDDLYFELLLSNKFRKNGNKLELLKQFADSEDYPVHLFPREFTLGEEAIIENTWNPEKTYAMKNAALSVEGIESFKLPDGKTVECIKLRVEIRENNGRNSLSYLWLVKDFGLVKWRSSTGRVWEIIRYAVPEYGSFPIEEGKYLLPPPEDNSTPK